MPVIELEDFLSLTRHEMLPNFLAFFEQKLEDFLSLTTHEVLPKLLVFLGAKIWGLSITYYMSQFFVPAKSSYQIWETVEAT